MHYLVPEGDGTFALREHGRRSGLEVELKASPNSEGYFGIDYRIDEVCPARGKLEGTTLDAGEPAFKKRWIDSGSRVLPVRGSLGLGLGREGPRSWFVFLFVASVEPRRK